VAPSAPIRNSSNNACSHGSPHGLQKTDHRPLSTGHCLSAFPVQSL
jgi:hypothetical protein